ncbi:MAG: Ldh family oxidoreductase [Sphaerochaetaceae bacterium]
MEIVRIERKSLEDFGISVFEKLGLSAEEAFDSSTILVSADARGIQSHGMARLWRYANGIKAGVMKTSTAPLVLRETPVSLVLDGQGSMGLSLSKNTMGQVIAKARNLGMGVASVRNSNHFGIAGYYAEMAARNDMIGIAMTNTAAMGVPTNGRDPMFGTNPIAVAIPASKGRIFCLDMATTCVTRGKIETYAREGASIPKGWAVNTEGHETSDAIKLIDDMLYLRGGGLLPLGGEGEQFSGYKGYGLAVLVDILCAVCSGGPFGKSVMDSEITSARVCHFFGAVRLDLFRDPEEFKNDLGKMLDELNATKPAQGKERVLYAGQKEHEKEIECDQKGVPLSRKVYEQLESIAQELGLSVPSVK